MTHDRKNPSNGGLTNWGQIVLERDPNSENFARASIGGGRAFRRLNK